MSPRSDCGAMTAPCENRRRFRRDAWRMSVAASGLATAGPLARPRGRGPRFPTSLAAVVFLPVRKSQCNAFRAASVVPAQRSRNWRARMTVAGASAILQNRKNRPISRRWFARTSEFSPAESSAVDQSGKLKGRCPKESIVESMPTHCRLGAVIRNRAAYPNEGSVE